MSEQTTAANGSSEATQVGDINREIAAAELQKLKLEILELQPKPKWSQRISRLIPIITATISIAGFLWGVVLFSDQQERARQQQERDRQTKEADQISRDKALYRSSYEQLLQFSSNQNMTVAQMLFLQKELNTLIDSIYPLAKNREVNEIQKQELAKSIFDLIHKDCDFTQARQVQFDIAAMRAEVGYQKGLEQSQNPKVIKKYLQALRDLQSKDPKGLENFRRTDFGQFQEPDGLLGDPYRSIIEGFSCHLKLLTDDQRDEAIRGFSNIIKDRVLTAELFSPGYSCP